MTTQNKDKIDQDYVHWQTSVRLETYGRPPEASNDNAGIATTLAALFSHDGDDFIHLVFSTFLDRPPSSTEFDHYKGLLYSGVGKSTIAARVRYSPEAIKRTQHLNLKMAYWFDKISAMPVVGYLARLLVTLALSPSAKMSLLSQHQAIQRLRNIECKLIRDIILAEEQQKLDHKWIGDSLKQEIKSLRDRQLELDDSIKRLHPDSAPGRDISQGTPVDDGFYIAFEEHFRGSEDVIRQRLTYYLPVLEQKLPRTEHAPRAVDIGCGRGEWISLLQQAGFAATGIDLNAANVATCQGKGLDAVQADGILWLRQTESRSLALISSFHVVEHLSLAQINSLLIEALRCLEPGGLLILETPNPENLVTAANRFYTDPSHRHPLPPDLLEFLLKYKGFTSVEIHRLHPVEGSAQFTEGSTMATTLNHLLFGPQDYAVIARKP